MPTGHKYIVIDKASKEKPYRVKFYHLGKFYNVGRYKDIETAIKKRDQFQQKLLIEDDPRLTEKNIPW